MNAPPMQWLFKTALGMGTACKKPGDQIVSFAGLSQQVSATGIDIPTHSGLGHARQGQYTRFRVIS